MYDLRKFMVSLVLVCVLLSGVTTAFAAVAGSLVSNNPNDWRLWVTRNQDSFTVRTNFLGDINNFADPRSVWTEAHFIVPYSDPSLDITSGTRLERTEYTSAGEVVYTYSIRALLKDDGTLWTSAQYPNGYTPRLNEIFFEGVSFLMQNGTVVTEEFVPSPFVLNRIPFSDTDGNDSNSSGGCSAGAFVPFAGVLLLPLAALYRRRQSR